MGKLEIVVSQLIKHAACGAPQVLRERLEEEWLADAWERSGSVSRLKFALSCYWAATLIGRDPGAQPAAATSTSTGGAIMTACAYNGPALFPCRSAYAQSADVKCEINITPLIDVMLVLLITLVVSLPLVTHAVKLDLPTATAATSSPPEIVDLDIDFDGVIVWNGKAIRSAGELESDLRAAAQKIPQPMIRLHADRHVKYDHVAKLLALLQRNHLDRVGFANTVEFNN